MRARAVEKNFQLYNKLFSFMAPNPGTRSFSRKYDGDVLRSADMSSAETLIEPESPKNEAFSVVQGEESATPNNICLWVAVIFPNTQR